MQFYKIRLTGVIDVREREFDAEKLKKIKILLVY